MEQDYPEIELMGRISDMSYYSHIFIALLIIAALLQPFWHLLQVEYVG